MSEFATPSHGSKNLISKSPIGLRELLDASPDPVFCVDSAGHWMWLNPAIESLTGYRAADLIGQSTIQLVMPSDRKRFLKTFLRLRTSRDSIPTFHEFGILTADRRVINLTVRVRVVQRTDGEMVFVGNARETMGTNRYAPPPGWKPAAAAAPPVLPPRLSVVPGAGNAAGPPVPPMLGHVPPPDSIMPNEMRFGAEPFTVTSTDRTAAKEANAAANDDLLAAKDNRILELMRELEDLRASTQGKSDLLASVSHEIRTPMAGIMGMSHLLLETPLNDRQRELVEVIESSGRTLLSLLNESLDFSRLDAGKLEIEEIDYDLRVTIDEIGSTLATTAREKNLGFECRVHHEVPSRVHGDAGRLRQVLGTLAGCVIRSTERGAVLLHVGRMEETEDQVTLRFGIVVPAAAMSEDKFTSIDQAYTQPESAALSRTGGAGLSLGVARRLVNLMGGEVGAETDPKTGDVFWFKLPLAKQPEIQDHADDTEIKLRQLRVLIADPSAEVRASMIEMLGVWGCRADQAENADQALEVLRSAAGKGTPYSLAVVDMQLPGGAEEQFAATVRKDMGLDDTRLLLLTAIGRRGDAQRAHTAGFAAYLLKPVPWSELYEALVLVMRTPHPRAGAEHWPLVTRHSIAEARRGRVRILLIEDNPVNRLVTDWALRRHGYTLDTVMDAGEAMEACERNRYDLIILDVQMPGMDGLKAASALRALERGGKRTPIVALTSNASAAERERCQSAGIDDVLKKPLDLGDLCDIVERWSRGGKDAEKGEAGTPTPSVRSDKPGATVADFGVVRGFQDITRQFETPAAAPAAPVGNPDVLDTARLDDASMGIPALREALLNTFSHDIPTRLERLAEAILAGDARRVEFESHGLKGMVGTVGAAACAAAFDDLERLGREERVAPMREALQRARAEVTRAQQMVEELKRISKAA